ncbi:MAG: PAS domain S-box protein [Myxococcales bacterium]|nr:PAS domain S-box protein [Myxococcales bacterium]
MVVVDADEAERRKVLTALAQARMPAVGVASLDELTTHVEAAGQPALVVLALPPAGMSDARARLGELLGPEPVARLCVVEADDDSVGLLEGFADDVVLRPLQLPELVARTRKQLERKAAVDELAQRNADAQVLVELTQALASSLDLREILHTVVVRTAEVSKVDRVSIVLVRDNEATGFVVVSSDDQKLRDLPIDLNQYPEIRHAIAERRPLLIEDAATHPLMQTVRGPERNSSIPFATLAIVPLLFEDRPMGVLFLRAREATSFDDRTLALLRTLANTTAVSLRNARILQSLRDQTQQITYARYEAERRMRGLQRYADFFESLDDGVLVMDTEGYLLFTNPRARQLTGYDEKDLEGKRILDVVLPEDRDKARSMRPAEGAPNKHVATDLRIRRKDGVVRIFALTWSSVLHESGAVLLSLRDVTNEREGVIELAQTKEFLEHLIESSVDAIVSADMHGCILLFNRAAERVYGCPASAMIGTSVERLYPEGIARKIMRLIRSEELGGLGRLEGFRTDAVAVTGERVPIILNAALMTRADKPIGTVGIFTDLRERMRIEQRLEHAQEQLRIQEKQTIVAELAGAAAHELNQPLTSVMGYAELLRRRLEPGTPQHHAADIIVGEAERMAEIVRKIGKITRYETKSYVGSARILDLDRASREDSSPQPDSTKPDSNRPDSGKGGKGAGTVKGGGP